MARVKLSPIVKMLRGEVDGIVFKRYGDRVVVSKCPDMSRVKRSAGQKDQLERMVWAGKYYRALLADPKLKACYARRAKKQKTTIHRLATKDYMRVSKEVGRVLVLKETFAAARQRIR